MKLLIEEYPYDGTDVAEVLDGLFTLQDVEKKVSVKYVGYYYNPLPEVRDVVFILPKVIIDDKGLVFGEYDPKDLIHLDEAKLTGENGEKQLKFLYEFAVWIHRAIVVFNNSHEKNKIVLHKQIESEGRGVNKKKSNTLLDIILSLIRFNNENRQFFTFILKNLHSGFNKINWNKTIARTPAIIQDDSPTYLNPVNKKRQVNFDEELIIIFFSILNHIHETYGFRTEINFGFKLITGAKFKRYLNGYGRTRLRQIKYKYYSDIAVKLWDLCYAFFDKTYKVRVNSDQKEYLLVKSFHVVFEAMIDELIGIPHEQLPKGLADQYDGKVVDHFYTYQGLLMNSKPDDDIYYIGDSKYYKIGNSLETKSIYKQRTYARNVIQWNLDIWIDGKQNMEDNLERIQLFDEVTEGYNIIPNFFISADIDKKTLSYDDRTELHSDQPPLSRQFKNRLYDRDTLLLSHYNVNFLHVLSLYARNNASAKRVWRDSVREKFRTAIQDMLKSKFDFFALRAHPDVDAASYFKTHFQEMLGKTFRPYDNKAIFSLALDKSFPEDNKRLRDALCKNFYVVPVTLGKDPTAKLETEQSNKGEVDSPDGMGKFLFGIVNKYKDSTDGSKQISIEYEAFRTLMASEFVMRNMPSGDISKARYFVPMFDGGFGGYYEILGISFGSRKQNVLDERGKFVEVSMPCLKLKLGSYHTLGRHHTEIPNYRHWNGQIHSYQELMELYDASGH